MEDEQGRSYTYIDTELGNYWVCNDCGASHEIADFIQHSKSCKPGDAKKWENFYEKES